MHGSPFALDDNFSGDKIGSIDNNDNAIFCFVTLQPISDDTKISSCCRQELTAP